MNAQNIPDTDPRPRCGACRWWVRWSFDTRPGPSTIGDCRHSAPRLVDNFITVRVNDTDVLANKPLSRWPSTCEKFIACGAFETLGGGR